MIQVENLSKYYNDFCAVDGINMTINSGQIMGLLGPNGAGKTTTLRMLTGFFRPTSGTIRINGQSISEDIIAAKRLMGYLPESAPLYHNMLVFDYLDYVGKLKGLDTAYRKKRLGELTDLCGLSEIMHKPINALSKGLKQRVGLAHAMISDPRILVLDEPTSGLDPNQIAEIRTIIKRIGREKTILFSTHILSEAESTCDRIVIINRGRIVADDTTRNLTGASGSRVRVSLAQADPDAAETLLAGIDGVTGVTASDPTPGQEITFEIQGNDGDDLVRKIYLAIRNTDWIITELTRDAQTLETIFQDLTTGD